MGTHWCKKKTKENKRKKEHMVPSKCAKSSQHYSLSENFCG